MYFVRLDSKTTHSARARPLGGSGGGSLRIRPRHPDRADPVWSSVGDRSRECPVWGQAPDGNIFSFLGRILPHWMTPMADRESARRRQGHDYIYFSKVSQEGCSMEYLGMSIAWFSARQGLSAPNAVSASVITGHHVRPEGAGGLVRYLHGEWSPNLSSATDGMRCVHRSCCFSGPCPTTRLPAVRITRPVMTTHFKNESSRRRNTAMDWNLQKHPYLETAGLPR